MNRNSLFNVFAVVALVVLAAFTLRQARATTEIVAGVSRVAQPRPYRSPLDVCFDVPLKDAAACRSAGQAYAPAANPTPAYRSPLDECFDVPLKDAAACRAATPGG
jgi:hypothetical protein